MALPRNKDIKKRFTNFLSDYEFFLQTKERDCLENEKDTLEEKAKAFYQLLIDIIQKGKLDKELTQAITI